MIDEPSAESSPESGKPIILGGPHSGDHDVPGEGAPPPALHDPEYEPEPEPVVTGAAAHEPLAPPPSMPPPSSEPVREKRSAIMPVLGVVGFLILAIAIGYLWVRPEPLPAMPAMPPDESGAVTALQSDVATLKTSLAALDQRESSDISALHAAIAALPAPAPTAASPSAPAAASAPSASATAPASATAEAAPNSALAQQVSSLSDRLNQIQASETAQAQQTQSLASAADLSKIASRVDATAQRESKDDAAVRQDLSLVQQQLASLSDQAQTLSKSSAALPQLTAQADRLSEVVRAQEALRAGLPLGTIANAPPALARYAGTAPPTEASLRLSFADAASAADKAGEPVPDQGHFWHRVWLKAQNLVMVRQGDHVVLGDPTSAILAHAQTELDAGDLAGTLTVLDTLNGPAAAAMAPWEAQARALLAARAALTQMAAG